MKKLELGTSLVLSTMFLAALFDASPVSAQAIIIDACDKTPLKCLVLPDQLIIENPEGADLDIKSGCELIKEHVPDLSVQGCIDTIAPLNDEESIALDATEISVYLPGDSGEQVEVATDGLASTLEWIYDHDRTLEVPSSNDQPDSVDVESILGGAVVLTTLFFTGRLVSELNRFRKPNHSNTTKPRSSSQPSRTTSLDGGDQISAPAPKAKPGYSATPEIVRDFKAFLKNSAQMSAENPRKAWQLAGYFINFFEDDKASLTDHLGASKFHRRDYQLTRLIEQANDLKARLVPPPSSYEDH